MREFTLAVVILAVAVPLNAGAPAAPLVGRWVSAPLELALTSDVHKAVYGTGAHSVRTVTLTIRPSGEGVFTVNSRVRDRKGAVVAGTQEIEEVRFETGDLVEEPGLRPHYTTRVIHAERRFADDPGSKFDREGVKLTIHIFEGRSNALEVRFDTPEGTGSFWETLQRAVRRTS